MPYIELAIRIPILAQDGGPPKSTYDDVRCTPVLLIVIQHEDISNGICTLSTPSKNLETVSPERAAAAARDPRTAVLMFDSSSGCEHWETALATNKEHDPPATAENRLQRKQKKRARQKTSEAS